MGSESSARMMPAVMKPAVSLPVGRGVGDDVDHPEPWDGALELVELVLVDDAVLGHAPVEDGQFLPRYPARSLGIGQIPQHAAHRSDSYTSGEEGDLGLVVAEEERAVRALDLHLGADGQRVERVLEDGAGEPRGQLDVRLGGRVGVAEVMVERALRRGDGDGVPLPRLEGVVGEAGRSDSWWCRCCA